MQAGEKKKTWDWSRFRPEHMTHWERNNPVMFPHLQTDHWTRMKTMVPVYLAAVPAALLKDRVDDSQGQTPHHTANSSLLPPLTRDESSINPHVPSVQRAGVPENRPHTSLQNKSQYRNVYNDRARRGFCYWLVEKKSSTCKGYSFGAYKTCLGLPKV